MEIYAFISIALSICAIAVGLGVYEMLVHRFLETDERLIKTKKQRENGHGNTGYALFAELVRHLERIMPLARSEAEEYRETLEKAGLPIEPETWRGIRMLCVLVALLSTATLALSGNGPLPLRCGLVVSGGFVGWAVPSSVLSVKTKKRQKVIDAQLPDAMELLGITVAAGSPVEQCFREVALSIESPLSDEFLLVDREVNLLGHSREEALKKLVRRCGSQGVSAFVAQLSQSISLGSSIAEGLASQASLARDMAQADVLERIRKMSTKLDIVLSLCFLPPMVALVTTPTIVTLISFFNNTLK